MDGFGLGRMRTGDAIHQAIRRGRAPFISSLFSSRPHSVVTSCGRAVGLPPGTMGNSEVNHLNMGAGRVVPQSLMRINNAVRTGDMFNNPAISQAIENVMRNGSTLHLMGIIQGEPGTVHGNILHLFGLLEVANKSGIRDIAIHLFTDGRDTGVRDAGEIYLPKLLQKIESMGMSDVAKIKTVMGREVAMDRDTAWDKTLAAMRMLVTGAGERTFKTAKEAIARSYSEGVTDEFIRPTVIGSFTGISPRDSVIFWNYRQDRGIQLTTAFRETDRDRFNYKEGAAPIEEEIYNGIMSLQQKVEKTLFLAMTEYYHGINAIVAYPEQIITPTVGGVVSDAGLAQLRLAGTEKFAHVTGWFSGRRSDPFEGEDRILAQDPTLKARTNEGKNYDWVPEMTVHLEFEKLVGALADTFYPLIVHNIQNPDMVGHTGNMDATIAAISHISSALEVHVPKLLDFGYTVVITSDHGNADEMLIKNVPSTKHSNSPVPFFAFRKGKKIELEKRGIVPDIGVTVLDLMGLPAPEEMTAKSLLK